MQVKLRVFSLPYGKQHIEHTEVDDSLRAAYEAIINEGCELQGEVLRTQEVSQTITHGIYGDFAIEITSMEEAKQGLERLLRGFNVASYREWIAERKA